MYHASMAQVLLDFGSGPGVFSLAAAANSRKAWAFDAASRSTDSFQASIAYNGFDKQIKVHTVRLVSMLVHTLRATPNWVLALAVLSMRSPNNPTCKEYGAFLATSAGCYAQKARP